MRARDDFDTALTPIPTLEPIPRAKHQQQPPNAEDTAAFLVHRAGDPPVVIRLSTRQAEWLRKLASSTATLGALRIDGDPRARKAMADLIAAGVPVLVVRERRSDGGAGFVATYRLAGEVEVVPQTLADREGVTGE